MELDLVFKFFVYISGCFMCVTLAPVYGAALDEVEQQQVFMKSEFQNNLEISNKRTFEVLNQPKKCSYKNLEKCHSNHDMHETYYERCYSDDCPSEKYYCLNVPDGISKHICGEPSLWRKRSRDIAVFNSAVSGHVDVYRTACPVGYFQENRKNAFTPCVKDESLIAMRKYTKEGPSLWRCNTLKNYCNPHGVTFFELGSDEDSCVHARYDLKMKCNPADELSPNCSCIQRCRASQERVWDGTNLCLSINESATISRGTDSVHEQVAKSKKLTTMSSRRTSYPADRNITSRDENLSVRNFERESTDNQTIMVFGLVVIGIILAIAVLCFVRGHPYKNGRCQFFQKSIQPVKTLNKSRVQITNNKYNVQTDTVNIRQEVPDLQHALVTEQDEATSGETNSIRMNGSSSEPLMQCMKDNDEQQPDSGICSESQTYVKELAVI